MATGDAILSFDGTATTVLAQTATLVTANYSTSSTFTVSEFDNSTDLWPMAVATLLLPETFSAAPTVNSSIDLYICERDVGGGTTDVTVPTATLQKGAKYIGSFRPLYATDEDQPLTVTFSLAGVRKATFAIYNGSGASLSYSAGGNSVKVEGFTVTPSA